MPEGRNPPVKPWLGFDVHSPTLKLRPTRLPERAIRDRIRLVTAVDYRQIRGYPLLPQGGSGYWKGDPLWTRHLK